MASRLPLLLLALAGPALAAAAEEACAPGDACAGVQDGEDSSLLQSRRHKERLDTVNRDSDALAGKSIYFILVDRFARSDGKTEACANNQAENNVWCGGTLRGLIDKLDYIVGMGFDCIWITPVVTQYPDVTPSGTGAMGYWARDLYEIDPHFGTSQDYHDLVAALHKNGMCMVQDFVANHMGPIHSAKDVEPMNPFNKPEHFHQLFRGNMTFDEYTHKKGNWPPPAQAMWSQSGAQCTEGQNCNCYKCQPDVNLLGLPPSYGPCNGQMVWDTESPCKLGTFSDYCKPGDYECEGYNETVTQQGWFYDLGDLNQSHPFVRAEQLKWIGWFVRTYGVDALRLDTAAFMTFDFLSELQAAAGVPIIGEVTATNLTYHAQFQANPPPSGRPVLDGVLNFPTYFTAIAAFCKTWFPFSQGNLTFLGERIASQLTSGLYKNLNTLGNFPDNHDVERITKTCLADISRVTNTVAWTMFSKGAPIIYYGTEVFMTWERESFWTYGYSTDTFMYKFLKFANGLRKDQGLALEDMEIVPTKDERTLVFTRGKRVWVYLNNLEETPHDVLYCGARPPAPEAGHVWADAQAAQRGAAELSGRFVDDCYVAKGSYPKFLVQVPEPQAAAALPARPGAAAAQ